MKFKYNGQWFDIPTGSEGTKVIPNPSYEPEKENYLETIKIDNNIYKIPIKIYWDLPSADNFDEGDIIFGLSKTAASGDNLITAYKAETDSTDNVWTKCSYGAEDILVDTGDDTSVPLSDFLSDIGPFLVDGEIINETIDENIENNLVLNLSDGTNVSINLDNKIVNPTFKGSFAMNYDESYELGDFAFVEGGFLDYDELIDTEIKGTYASVTFDSQTDSEVTFKTDLLQNDNITYIDIIEGGRMHLPVTSMSQSSLYNLMTCSKDSPMDMSFIVDEPIERTDGFCIKQVLSNRKIGVSFPIKQVEGISYKSFDVWSEDYEEYYTFDIESIDYDTSIIAFENPDGVTIQPGWQVSLYGHYTISYVSETADSVTFSTTVDLSDIQTIDEVDVSLDSKHTLELTVISFESDGTIVCEKPDYSYTTIADMPISGIYATILTSNEASGDASHAEGIGTIALGDAQHVMGKYNESDSGQYAVIVGNGYSDDSRQNAFTLDWQGNLKTSGTITDGQGHVLGEGGGSSSGMSEVNPRGKGSFAMNIQEGAAIGSCAFIEGGRYDTIPAFQPVQPESLMTVSYVSQTDSEVVFEFSNICGADELTEDRVTSKYINVEIDPVSHEEAQFFTTAYDTSTNYVTCDKMEAGYDCSDISGNRLLNFYFCGLDYESASGDMITFNTTIDTDVLNANNQFLYEVAFNTPDDGYVTLPVDHVENQGKIVCNAEQYSYMDFTGVSAEISDYNIYNKISFDHEEGGNVVFSVSFDLSFIYKLDTIEVMEIDPNMGLRSYQFEVVSWTNWSPNSGTIICKPSSMIDAYEIDDWLLSDGTYNEILGNSAAGDAAHAEGQETDASGAYSHAEGLGTVADGPAQHVGGMYNEHDYDQNYIMIIGNGSADSDRHNAMTLDWEGNLETSGTINGFRITSITQAEYDALPTPRDANTIFIIVD